MPGARQLVQQDADSTRFGSASAHFQCAQPVHESNLAEGDSRLALCPPGRATLPPLWRLQAVWQQRSWLGCRTILPWQRLRITTQSS